jgi:cell division protein FtsQ
MWHSPDALNRLSALLVVMVVASAVWLGGRVLLDQNFPFRQVNVLGVSHAETRQAARALIPQLAGGFFSMNLQAVRERFEALPWVRRADVRRLWPGRLEVVIEEHRPAAAWNDRAMLNTYGEVFAVEPVGALPRFYAPDDLAAEVARQYGSYSAIVAPLNLKIEQLIVSRRLSWRVRLSGNISVELGRERMAERLTRFTHFYPQVATVMGSISRIDMRYPNGFAAQGEAHRKQPA